MSADTLMNRAQQLLPKASQLVKYLYDHPETPCHETLASKAMVEALRKYGFSVTYPFMEKELGYGTAFKAILSHGEGPKASILVEYDALPGIGHGCGHNLHGTMSILAAAILASEPFQGTLEVIGTPAEEEEGAKLHMSEAGIFDDLDFAIMMHSTSVVTQTDMDATALRCYIVEFFGKSAHAAGSPWLGHNALTAARKFLDLLDACRASFRPGTVLSGVILEGGRQPSMIPDYAKIRMEFRFPSLKEIKNLDQIVRNCAKGASIALGCTEKFTLGFPDFYDMVRLPILEQKVSELFNELDEKIVPAIPGGTSTDVGNVSYHCPAIQPMLCITKEPYSLHTPEFRDETIKPLAQQQMAKGAVVIAEMVLAILQDAAFRCAVREQFQKALAEKKG